MGAGTPESRSVGPGMGAGTPESRSVGPGIGAGTPATAVETETASTNIVVQIAARTIILSISAVPQLARVKGQLELSRALYYVNHLMRRARVIATTFLCQMYYDTKVLDLVRPETGLISKVGYLIAGVLPFSRLGWRETPARRTGRHGAATGVLPSPTACPGRPRQAWPRWRAGSPWRNRSKAGCRIWH